MLGRWLAYAIIAWSAPAAAAEWQKISTAKDGMVVSIDVESVRMTPPTVRAWVRLDASGAPQYPFAEARTLWQIDCSRDLQATVSATSYAEDGSVRSTSTTHDVERAYEPIVPDSYAATIRDILCPIAAEIG